MNWSVAAGITGFLAIVELSSGILPGFRAALMTGIARNLGIRDAEVNRLEAAQLMDSACAVPLLASLGDIFGHRKMLPLSAIAAAPASRWWCSPDPSRPS